MFRRHRGRVNPGRYLDDNLTPLSSAHRDVDFAGFRMTDDIVERFLGYAVGAICTSGGSGDVIRWVSIVAGSCPARRVSCSVTRTAWCSTTSPGAVPSAGAHLSQRSVELLQQTRPAHFRRSVSATQQRFRRRCWKERLANGVVQLPAGGCALQPQPRCASAYGAYLLNASPIRVATLPAKRRHARCKRSRGCAASQ